MYATKPPNNMAGAQPAKAALVQVTYYTDPLCCWSWAMQEDWNKLQQYFTGKLSVRYCMGGLLPSWQVYHDTLNAVTRPIQMGPVWMHARQLSGATINDKIWINDPPSSSFPSCIAYKCVELQSLVFAEQYLLLLRQAVMVNAQNIARTEVLQSLAFKLKSAYPNFDVDQFNDDLVNGNGKQSFAKDFNEVQQRGIDRFPTFIIRHQQQAIMLTGYRPYQALAEAIHQLAPSLNEERVAS